LRAAKFISEIRLSASSWFIGDLEQLSEKSSAGVGGNRTNLTGDLLYLVAKEVALGGELRYAVGASLYAASPFCVHSGVLAY
jgi:hypothetical protein